MVLFILTAAAILIALLLFFRIKIEASYDESFQLKLKYLFISVDSSRFEKKAEKPKRKQKQIPGREKKGILGTAAQIKAFLDFLDEFKETIAKVFSMTQKRLRADFISADITIAGDDACQTAIYYGETYAAAAAFFAAIQNFMKVKRQHADILADFNSGKTSIVFKCRLSIRLGGLVAVALSAAFGMLCTIIGNTIKKQRGVNNERTSYTGSDGHYPAAH